MLISTITYLCFLVCLCQRALQHHSEEDKVGFTLTPGGNLVQRILSLEGDFGILNLLPYRLERLTLFSECTQLYREKNEQQIYQTFKMRTKGTLDHIDIIATSHFSYKCAMKHFIAPCIPVLPVRFVQKVLFQQVLSCKLFLCQ